MKISRLLPVAAALSSCTLPAFLSSPAVAQAPKSATPKASYSVVLSLSEGSNMALSVHPVLPATGSMTFWTPTAADLRQLEKYMPKSLASYDRQYIGAKQGGKRLILINGFSHDLESEFVGGKFDWHKSTVSVMDGGTGFFQATYDPDKHVFNGPHFNGVG